MPESPNQRLIAKGISEGLIAIDAGRIKYIVQKKEYDFSDPEELVRALAYLNYVERYKYPPKRIDFEVYPPQREPKLPADIVVYDDDKKEHPFIVTEVKAHSTAADIEEAKGEGLGNANLLLAKYVHLVCRGVQAAYDLSEHPSLKRLEKHRIADIPIAYGKAPSYKYVKGGTFDLKTVDFNELRRKFQACHDEIWEGGKRDPSESFDEMSKIMFAKIFDERFTKSGDSYQFQIGTHESPEVVAKRVKSRYSDAQAKEPNIFTSGIKVSNRILFQIVGFLEDISLTNTDLDAKGRAFESFLGEVFRGKLGQYFTRREIVEFMVQMLEPHMKDILIDPACGSGGFLLYCLEAVRDQIKTDYAGDKKTATRFDSDFSQQQVFGIEVNDRIARVAMMDMVLHDDGHTNIEPSDALGDWAEFDKRRDIQPSKYSLVLTNPPFGAKVKDQRVLKHFRLGSKLSKRKAQKTELLFLERCLDLLRKDGRMGIVLPDGILSNPSLRNVRNALLEQSKLMAIVSLPQGAFIPSGSNVKASLVFLRKATIAADEDYPVFMAVANHIGYDPASRPDKNELPKILEKWRQFKLDPSSFPSKTDSVGFVVRRADLTRRLDSLFYYYQKLEKKRQGDSTLDEMADLIRDQIDPRKHPADAFGYVDLEDIDETTGKVRLIRTKLGREIKGGKNRFQESDILFARIEPSVFNRKTAIVRDCPPNSVCSTEFYVIKAHDDVDPEFLFWMLRSDRTVAQVFGKMTGTTGRRRLDRDSLLSLLIPKPPSNIQKEIALLMKQTHEKQLMMQEEASKLISNGYSTANSKLEPFDTTTKSAVELTKL